MSRPAPPRSGCRLQVVVAGGRSPVLVADGADGQALVLDRPGGDVAGGGGRGRGRTRQDGQAQGQQRRETSLQLQINHTDD